MTQVANKKKPLTERLAVKFREAIHWSNCLVYAVNSFFKGGYFVMRRSKYYPGPHFLHGVKNDDGTLDMTSFVPDAHKKRASPPWFFAGHIKKGDAESTIEKKETMDKYVKQLDEFAQKSAELKTRILDYKEGEKLPWEAFKNDFNHVLDKSGKEISAVAKKNLKKN